MQQLLREWEANLLAKANNAADCKPGRARRKLEESPDPTLEQPVELALGPCPCDRCEFRQRCAAGLACERYSMFLDGAGQKSWEAATCEPTRTRFEALPR